MSLRARASIRVLPRHTLSTHTIMAEGIMPRLLLLLLTFSNKRPKLTFSRQSHSAYSLWTTGTTPQDSETGYFTVQCGREVIQLIGGTLHLTVILCHSSDYCRSPYQLLVCMSHPLGILLIPLNFKEFRKSLNSPHCFSTPSAEQKKNCPHPSYKWIYKKENC